MTAKGNSPQRRVMVIALDGATWDLARPWTLAGCMPNLARLVSEGVSAGMRAELPPSSVPNWPAFMTGKNAGKHGCVWWLQKDANGYLDGLPIDSRSISGDTLWTYLSSFDKKVIVQNVPVTYPVEPVNGVMISGLLTPRTADDFVFPSSIKPELDAVVGGYQIYPQAGYAHGREETFIEDQIANIRHHTQAADYLLSTREWDFFILVLGPTDEAAHKLWHYMDPQHPLYKSQEAARFGDSLQRIYSSADEAIGLLSRHLTPDDLLIVMSDHGFGPVESLFNVNNWLLKQGYLRLRRSSSTSMKRLLFRAGFTPSNVYPLGKQALSFFRNSGVIRQRLDPGRQGSQSPLRRIFLSNEDIDWSQTRVFATGFLYGQLFINLRDRDPEGIVAPNEYETLRSKLIDELATLINPATGKPHYNRIYRREEVYSGQFLDLMPDLLCVPSDLKVPDSGMGFRSNRLFDRDSAISGTHREVGIFAMKGSGVRSGMEIPEIRIYDIAPTILYCLNLSIPEDMDGQVITNAFEESELASRQIRFIPPRHSRSRNNRDLDAVEDETVKKRLRDLGYLA